MKIQNTPNMQFSVKKQDSQSKNNSNLAFGGGEAITTALNFVQTNQAVGACLVDMGSMCIPRTAVDYTRSPEAGKETAIREFSCNFNNVALGTYGVGAAYLLSRDFNKTYDVQGNKIFADVDSLDIMTHVRNEKGDIRKSENLKSYLNEILDHTSGYNPVVNGGNGWAHIASEDKGAIVERLVKELNPEAKVTKSDKEVEGTKAYLKALITRATGSEGHIKLEKELSGSARKAEISAVDFVDNLYEVSKSFMSENVIAESGLIKEDFLKGLKGMHTKTAIAGLAICMAVGASVQPINMYLTKKKTGKEGFVGVEGREADKSDSFKAVKAGIAALAVYGTLMSITKSPKVTPKEILNAVKFKGFVPTINQFKLVYGATISSRILSSRDKNELRETSIKDSLGFANWLILGGFASNLAAMGIEKITEFKNNNVKFLKDSAISSKMPKWITGSIVSREEVLQKTLKDHGIDVVKGDKALSFKEMLKEISTNAKITRDEGALLKSRIKWLGAIQFVGYLWSGLALGVGVPKLNIAITNAAEKKNKAKMADASAPKIENTELAKKAAA